MIRPKLIIRYSLLGLIGGIIGFFSLLVLTSLGVVAVEWWFDEDGLLYRLSSGDHNLADSGIFFVIIGIAVFVTAKIAARLKSLRQRNRNPDTEEPL